MQGSFQKSFRREMANRSCLVIASSHNCQASSTAHLGRAGQRSWEFGAAVRGVWSEACGGLRVKRGVRR